MRRMAIQWTLMSVLTAIGLLALLVLMGEESEGVSAQFVACKAVALAVLEACLLIGKALHRKGLLPSELDEDI